jgi:hypothetical protein
MSLEERVTELEKLAGKHDTLLIQLRDAVTVTAELEARQGRVLKGQADEMAAHADWLRSHQAAMADLDNRISGLVSGIGKLIERIQ